MDSLPPTSPTIPTKDDDVVPLYNERQKSLKGRKQHDNAEEEANLAYNNGQYVSQSATEDEKQHREDPQEHLYSFDGKLMWRDVNFDEGENEVQCNTAEQGRGDCEKKDRVWQKEEEQAHQDAEQEEEEEEAHQDAEQEEEEEAHQDAEQEEEEEAHQDAEQEEEEEEEHQDADQEEEEEEAHQDAEQEEEEEAHQDAEQEEEEEEAHQDAEQEEEEEEGGQQHYGQQDEEETAFKETVLNETRVCNNQDPGQEEDRQAELNKCESYVERQNQESQQSEQFSDSEPDKSQLPVFLQASCVPQSVNELSITSGARAQDAPVDLRDIQQQLQGLALLERGSFLDRYLATESVTPVRASSVTHVDPQLRTSLLQAAQVIDSRRRVPNKQIFRRKLVLLGYQEVGKTSLRKCFESEPYFFRNLPSVKTTTGVEVHSKDILVRGDPVQLILSDFAGQEAYHSHTLFLTDRSIFLLVWKISAVEQDFQGSGISSNEEERLYKWIAEVYAKFPHAKIALVATHLDELRVKTQRGVEMILMKVEGKIMSFMNRIASTDPQTGARVMNEIVGNFAVSCKSRSLIAAGGLRSMSDQTISSMLQFFAEVAHRDCMEDPEYPAAAIPGRHVRLLDEVAEKKSRFPQKLLMPLSEFVHSAVQFGVESDAELLQIALLMHSWNIIFLFNPNRIADNVFVMLHPLWLSRLAAALFSYAHILRTPLHLRSVIGGLEYTVSHAEAADMHLMKKGFLRLPLARVLFHRPLRDALQREPDDSDYMMALQLLRALSLIVPVNVPCDEFSLLEEETAADPEAGRAIIHDTKVTRYFVPSLSPYGAPSRLKRLAPVLFNRGAKVRFDFNLLPNEAWWRLQAQLQQLQQVVVVYKPCGLLATDAEAEDDILDDYRLREADEEHNRWSDAMWLRGENCRVFLYRDGMHGIRIFSTETRPKGAEEVLEVIERLVAELLDAYRGLQRVVCVACPEPNCEGWLPAEEVATGVRVTCGACRQTVRTADIVASGVGPRGGRRFSETLLGEAGELLRFSLDQKGCERMSEYLGLPFRSAQGIGEPQKRRPSDTDEDENKKKGNSHHDNNMDEDEEGNDSPLVQHMDYLYALDKIVRAVLLRDLRERLDGEARRQRMLEPPTQH